MSRVLRFSTNIPVQLAVPVLHGLPILTGKKKEELFITVDGQRFKLPEQAAISLRNTARAYEPFMVCKRHGKFDVWLSNQAERQRAAEEAPGVRELLRSGAGAVDTEGRGAQHSTLAPSAPPETSPTDPAPIRLGRETVIDFPAPKSRPDQEHLKPTGTDSLPVPRLQPRLQHAGFDVDGDTCEDLKKERYELESAEAGGERRLDSGAGCEQLGGPTVARKSAQGSSREANPVISLPLSSPASVSTSVAMRLQPGQNRQASITNRPPQPPGRVGYRQALHHICSTVSEVLKETGLPLGDGPLQDLISTVFIAAQKDKAIDFDFGEAA